MRANAAGRFSFAPRRHQSSRGVAELPPRAPRLRDGGRVG